MEEIKEAAKVELARIKQEATKEEWAKLVQSVIDKTLYGHMVDKCVYGTMTGNCYSPRAHQLMDLCSDKEVCFSRLVGFDHYRVKQLPLLPDNSWRHYTSLEVALTKWPHTIYNAIRELDGWQIGV